jgi:hypothetical protein
MESLYVLPLPSIRFWGVVAAALLRVASSVYIVGRDKLRNFSASMQRSIDVQMAQLSGHIPISWFFRLVGDRSRSIPGIHIVAAVLPYGTTTCT